MPVVEIKNLTKDFGKVKALDGVNLSVEEGEVYGYIGPNGSGKTTTIRIMLGTLRANMGEAKIFGKDSWRDAVEIHKNIAYIPGEVSLWPNLTGGEVIDLFIKLRGSNGSNRRDELIERFDLDPTKKCGTYSKGNRQKVALIAAFAIDADLFILDEPSSGLDPLMVQVFQECVKEVKQQGSSVFLSSHILSEVEKLCDKVSIIREGRIIESGTLSQMRHLTRTRILVETRHEVTGLGSYEGVHDLEQDRNLYTFQVDTEKLGTLIKYVGGFDVLKIESAPPTLEDLFLRYYKQDGGEG